MDPPTKFDPRLNLALIFISMGFVAHSPPNYAAAKQSLGVDPGPVVTQAFVNLPLYSKVRQPVVCNGMLVDGA